MKPEVSKNDLVLDKLNEELEQKDSIAQPFEKIADHILNNVDEIDIKEKYNIAKGENSNHIGKKTKVYVAINELDNISEQLDLAFGVSHESVYFYNKAYWEKIDKEHFKCFLADVSNKLGLHKHEVEYHRFKDDLFYQFCSRRHLILKNKHDDGVKINFKNGTLHLKKDKCELKNFNRFDYFNYQLNFNYDIDATCPKFDNYFNGVLPEVDLQKITFEHIGSVFLHNRLLKTEKALILYGDGENGKSVLFDIIEALIGKTNICNFDASTLTSNPNARASLAHALLNYSSEISEIKNVDMFKKLTSGEAVDAKLLYQDRFNISNYARLMFNSNNLPKNIDSSHGYFRRLLIIPFDKKISKSQRDKYLAQKIIYDELPGIMNYVTGGIQRLIENDGEFTESKKMDDLINQYETNSDSVKKFIHENNYRPESTGEEYLTLTKLYNEYFMFCESNGYRNKFSKPNFRSKIEKLGFLVKRRSEGNVVFCKKQDIS